MYKTRFTSLYFDIENIVDSAWTRMNERVRKGQMDRALLFTRKQITPHVVDTIQEMLANDLGGSLSSQAIVPKGSKDLVDPCEDKFSNVVEADEGKKSLEDAREVDLLLLEIFDSCTSPGWGDIGIILVSGDAGYIDELIRLFKLGYQVMVVSPKWSLSRKFYYELGKRAVIAVDDRWLDEVIRRTFRGLARAG
jgi:hypothetical protein